MTHGAWIKMNYLRLCMVIQMKMETSTTWIKMKVKRSILFPGNGNPDEAEVDKNEDGMNI